MAIYRKTKPGSGYMSYEVVVIRCRPPHPRDQEAANLYDVVEHYPCSEDWGTYGFTFCDRGSASIKYKQLLKRPTAGVHAADNGITFSASVGG